MESSIISITNVLNVFVAQGLESHADNGAISIDYGSTRVARVNGCVNLYRQELRRGLRILLHLDPRYYSTGNAYTTNRTLLYMNRRKETCGPVASDWIANDGDVF